MNRLKLDLNTVVKGDCLEVLKTFPSDSIDLIVTSPPYADNRKGEYGGVPMDKYVEWFLPISKELLRVLKPDGSFVLNIKERVSDGERHEYVLELILAIKRQGWFWIEEYIWHKKNCFPGKWPNRFRDAWERCLHLTKSKKFRMYQDAVKVPIGAWAEKRLAKLSETDLVRDESKSQSGFGKKIANWVGKEYVYPTNVLHLATECSNKGHPAAYPEELPAWFIKVFTKEDDIILDPFLGSGTTAVAAMKLKRHFAGIEMADEYYQLALRNINECRGYDSKQKRLGSDEN